MTPISSFELGPILCNALGIDFDKVRRIILDVDATEPNGIAVYIEAIGDERLLAINWARNLQGAEIVREGRS